MATRFNYFIAFILIVIAGILSRKVDGIPFFMGDSLYAIMVYAGLQTLFLLRRSHTAFFALLFCFAIEISQLFQYDWLITARKTLLGRYILGQGFLWSDLSAYTLGVLLAFALDSIINKKTGKHSSGL